MMREGNVRDTRSFGRRRVNVRYIVKNLGRYIKPYAALFVSYSSPRSRGRRSLCSARRCADLR